MYRRLRITSTSIKGTVSYISLVSVYIRYIRCVSRRRMGARAAALLVLGSLAAAELTGLGSLLPGFIADNVDDLLKVAADTCETLPLELLFSREHTPEVPYLDLVEFTQSGQRSYRAGKAHHRLRNASTSPLLIYIPGWWNTPTDESSDALVTALLQKHPLVLVVDTRLTFCRGYLGSASRVKAVAYLLYNFIKNLNREGLRPKSIHLIGFSLGAHVAGVTGKLVKSGLKTKLGRIIALDPAKPCFARSDFRLNKDDASFVQVVHSSAGVLGLEVPVGHADIYINGLYVKQPECRGRSITLECDHAMSWKLYSASVSNERSLMGRKCLTWKELSKGQCTGDENLLGYECSNKLRGVFLYKSENLLKNHKVETEVRAFNPFDIRTWWRR